MNKICTKLKESDAFYNDHSFAIDEHNYSCVCSSPDTRTSMNINRRNIIEFKK